MATFCIFTAHYLIRPPIPTISLGAVRERVGRNELFQKLFWELRLITVAGNDCYENLQSEHVGFQF